MFATSGPIGVPEDDEFGYADFAKALAIGIVSRSNLSEPYVIGIDAAWGMGKTSAANLLIGELDKLGGEQTSDERRICTILFSPWIHTSLNALAISYIGEITGAIDKCFAHRLKDRWKPVRKRVLQRYGELLATGAGAVTDLNLPAWAAPAASSITKLLTQVADDSTEKVAADLRNVLRHLDAGQIVVIVDDIDRLHPDEMRNILTLITTFGNLPRVTHVILHDRNIVDKAMQTSLLHGASGGPTYLEKIINLPTALPTVSSVALRDFFMTGLAQVLSPMKQSDEETLRELWRSSLKGVLRSPRDIGRLCNALAAIWPSISDHVLIADLVGIESLRVAAPEAWTRVRDLRRVLVGESDPTLHDGMRTITADELAGNPASIGAIKLIGWLFPRVETVTALKSATDVAMRERGKRAIHSPESVDVYFRFQPGAVMGRSVLDSLLTDADPVTIAQKIVAVGDRVSLRSIIDDLASRLPDIPIEPNAVFRALCEAGDALIARPTNTPPALHDVDVFNDLDEVLWILLRQMPLDTRLVAVKFALAESRSIALPVIIWQRLAMRSGYTSSERSSYEELLPRQRLDELARELSNRLHGEFAKGNLPRVPMLGWIIRIWWDAEKVLKDDALLESLANIANQLAHDGQGLLHIVDGLMGHAVSSDVGHFRTVDQSINCAGLHYSTLRKLSNAMLEDASFEITSVERAVLEAFVNPSGW